MPADRADPTDPLAPLVELPGVRAAVDSARDAVDRLLGHRAVRRRSGEVSTESALRGAWASARLAGAEVTLEEMRAGLASAHPAVQGALRAQAAIGPLADTWSRAPRQVLARLHAVAAADLVADAAQLGRPVGGSDVARRLGTLSEVLDLTRAPAPVVAAVVHGELLAVDAFAPASGIVARAAVRLTLVERGLDPKSLVVVEAGHLELASEYRTVLADYRAGTPDGVARWLVHCANAVALGAREALAVCEALTRG